MYPQQSQPYGQNQQMQNLQQKYQGPKEWLNPITGCTKNMKDCLCCLCCPLCFNCCTYPNVIASTGERTCFEACFVESFLFPLVICTDSNRRKLLKRYQMEESAGATCLYKVFCGPCSRLQEINEIRQRDNLQE